MPSLGDQKMAVEFLPVQEPRTVTNHISKEERFTRRDAKTVDVKASLLMFRARSIPR